MKYGKREVSNSFRGHTRWARFIGIHCDPVVLDGWIECGDPGFLIEYTFYTIGDLSLVLNDYKEAEELEREKRKELEGLEANRRELFEAMSQNITEPTICNGYFLNWTDDYFQITKGIVV